METPEYIAMQKMVATPEEVCGDKSQALLEFVQAVYSLQFDEAPKYNDLALILRNSMTQNDENADGKNISHGQNVLGNIVTVANREENNK